MSDKLTVVLNGQAVVEYDRNKPLPEQQHAYLDKMDQEMDKGLQIGAENIARTVCRPAIVPGAVEQ